MSRTHKRYKGFTLIELMVTIIILTLLATTTVPMFIRMSENFGHRQEVSKVKAVLQVLVKECIAQGSQGRLLIKESAGGELSIEGEIFSPQTGTWNAIPKASYTVSDISFTKTATTNNSPWLSEPGPDSLEDVAGSGITDGTVRRVAFFDSMGMPSDSTPLFIQSTIQEDKVTVVEIMRSGLFPSAQWDNPSAVWTK